VEVVHKSCEKHPFETADGMCHQCGRDYCGECLVFARGPKKPPACISCALAMAGVRSSASVAPKYVKEDMRRLRRAHRKVFRGGRAAADEMVSNTTEPAPDADENAHWGVARFGAL
jgi:hypothetical protein